MRPAPEGCIVLSLDTPVVQAQPPCVLPRKPRPSRLPTPGFRCAWSPAPPVRLPSSCFLPTYIPSSLLLWEEARALLLTCKVVCCSPEVGTCRKLPSDSFSDLSGVAPGSPVLETLQDPGAALPVLGACRACVSMASLLPQPPELLQTKVVAATGSNWNCVCYF